MIVPSIAIREGVFKSFQDSGYFQELYGHKINPFIYNSGRPQDIENFASDNRISVMIINTQHLTHAERMHVEFIGNWINSELENLLIL